MQRNGIMNHARKNIMVRALATSASRPHLLSCFRSSFSPLVSLAGGGDGARDGTSDARGVASDDARGDAPATAFEAFAAGFMLSSESSESEPLVTAEMAAAGCGGAVITLGGARQPPPCFDALFLPDSLLFRFTIVEYCQAMSNTESITPNVHMP